MKKKLISITSTLLTACCVLAACAAIVLSTPAPEEKPTRTPYPTRTPKPTEINELRIPATSEPITYAGPFNKIWAGVTVYTGSPPVAAFVILGGAENCENIPSGRGIKVRYPSGSEEWKDREHILTSGLYQMKSSDPAIKQKDWFVFDCP